MEFKFYQFPDSTARRPVMVALSPIVRHSLPHPDPCDPNSMLLGVLKRFCFRPSPPELDLLRRFGVFVDEWLSKHLEPLSPETDVSVSTWLASTNYPEWRRNELFKVYEDMGDVPVWTKPNWCKVKQFMKDESYSEYKYPRPINARVDQFKVATGPYFKAIEKVLFKLKWFVKYVPVEQRSQYVYDLLHVDGAKYCATDFTSFESLFVRVIMEVCEMKLYHHMTRRLPTYRHFVKMLGVILGRNSIHYKYFLTKLNATRMSGEMNTSLGNGFSNLMFMFFMCRENGNREVDGAVEGDDGLFRMLGEPPTADFFRRLGLELKIEVHDSLSTASFCGIVFDVYDKNNLCDPVSSIYKLLWIRGYTSSRKHKLEQLMYCRALSMAHQYPGCPIVQEFAHMMVRCIKRNDVTIQKIFKSKRCSHWEREWWSWYLAQSSLPHKTIGIGSRKIVEEKFGVPIPVQLELERLCSEAVDWEKMPLSMLDPFVPASWQHYGMNYVYSVPAGFNIAMMDWPTQFAPTEPLDCEAVVEKLSKQ